MSEYNFYSNAPAHTETLLLGAWVDGPFGSQFQAQEREAFWLRDESAQTCLLWDGELLDEKGQWCNVQAGFEDGEGWVDRLKLTTSDRLEVRVTATISERPVQRVKSRYDWYPHEYRTLEKFYTGTAEELARVAAWRYADWSTWQEGEWSPECHALRPRVLAEAIVFSSKRTSEENVETLATFLSTFAGVEVVK